MEELNLLVIQFKCNKLFGGYLEDLAWFCYSIHLCPPYTSGFKCVAVRAAQFAAVRQPVAVRAAVCNSSAWCAAVRAVVCGSASGIVRQCGSVTVHTAVSTESTVSGSAAVCGSVR